MIQVVFELWWRLQLHHILTAAKHPIHAGSEHEMQAPLQTPQNLSLMRRHVQ